MLIDSSLKAWLLEINTNPGMDYVNCKWMAGCIHRDCPLSTVDYYVKKQVLLDAVELVILENNGKKLSGEDQAIEERFKSFARVFPCKEGTANTELYENIRYLTRLFMRLSRA